jgi:capsular polysaccharide transport system permease protein
MSHVDDAYGPAPIMATLRRYWRSMVALIMRDMKTRYLGSAWGMLISIAWPLGHIVILMSFHLVMGRVQPYGDSAAMWYASGILPFMAFSYMSRFIMVGLVINAPLLSFPAIKILDIIFARAIVEILSTGVVCFCVYLVLLGLDVVFIPQDITTAFFAMFLCVLLGVGFGLLNALLAKVSPFMANLNVLFIIILWLASGVFFLPSQLPELAQYILSFNPLLHSVALARASFYDGYGASFIDTEYTLWFGLTLVALSLFMERLMRGRLLQ